MKYKKLSEKQTTEFIKLYYTLVDSMDEIHSLVHTVLQKKYNDYVQNFNPKFLYFFTRKQLSFDDFISDALNVGYIHFSTHSNKQYLELSFYYSSGSTPCEIRLSDSESTLIRLACSNSMNILRKHNKYINRLKKYAEQPLELSNDDFDNFDNYKTWNNEIQTGLETYRNNP